MTRALDELARMHAEIRDTYFGDCLTRARRLAELLRAEGVLTATVKRLRKCTTIGDDIFHGPLIPLAYRGRQGPTWTTHYVCCTDTAAYDPILGQPIPLEEYAQAVFGESLPLEAHGGV